MRALVAVLLFMLSSSLFAGIEVYRFDDPFDEQRYKALVTELRCLVCQNQNIADSNAELAQDLRQQTYEMIQKGESNEAIISYMVDRYGDFVLYRPPVKQSTIMLWVGPFMILIIAILVLVRVIKGRADERDELPDQQQLDEAEALLKAEPEEKKA